MNTNTLFLRLEGALQAWGVQESKFVVRRTAEAPTKSALIGLLSAAKGITREKAIECLPKLSKLSMGVRIDRPGIRWWDYHTIGAQIGSRTAQGKIKRTASTGEIETLVSRREYLCDASFLVALQGDAGLIESLYQSLISPKWTLFLGRKSCPPSRPILDPKTPPAFFNDLESALCSIPSQPRMKDDETPTTLTCLLDWIPSESEQAAPHDAEVWYDVPLSFEPPSHRPRFVIRKTFTVSKDGVIGIGEPLQHHTPSPPRMRANYSNTQWKNIRDQRLAEDHALCVFCKSRATDGHHTSYRNAGREETYEVRSLCRLCHDAVTMIEYGHNMGLDRIDPMDDRWRDAIIKKRDEIVAFRSLETRHRRLEREEVE